MPKPPKRLKRSTSKSRLKRNTSNTLNQWQYDSASYCCSLAAKIQVTQGSEQEHLIFQYLISMPHFLNFHLEKKHLKKNLLSILKLSGAKPLMPFFNTIFAINTDILLNSPTMCEIIQILFCRAPDFVKDAKYALTEVNFFALHFDKAYNHIVTNFSRYRTVKSVMSILYNVLKTFFEHRVELEKLLYGNSNGNTNDDEQRAMKRRKIFDFGKHFDVTKMIVSLAFKFSETNCTTACTDPIVCPVFTFLIMACDRFGFVGFVNRFIVKTFNLIHTESSFDPLTADTHRHGRVSFSSLGTFLKIFSLTLLDHGRSKVAQPLILQIIESHRETRQYLTHQFCTRFMNKYDIDSSSILLAKCASSIGSPSELKILADYLQSIDVINTCLRLNKPKLLIAIIKCFSTYKHNVSVFYKNLLFIFRCENSPEQFVRCVIQWKRANAARPKITECCPSGVAVIYTLADSREFNILIRESVDNLNSEELCVLMNDPVGSLFLQTVLSIDSVMGRDGMIASLAKKVLGTKSMLFASKESVIVACELCRVGDSTIRDDISQYAKSCTFKKVYARRAYLREFNQLLDQLTKRAVNCDRNVHARNGPTDTRFRQRSRTADPHGKCKKPLFTRALETIVDEPFHIEEDEIDETNGSDSTYVPPTRRSGGRS
ncbi:hypothetical protein ACOME3_001871 [Neoechinorhynchus agilis]